MAVEVTVKSNLPEFKSAFAALYPIALEMIGQAAEANAVRHITDVVYNGPEAKSGYVRTGNLRRSISHSYDASSGKAYIGTNVYYAPYVELGTKKMAARPYLKPAATEHGDEYRGIIKRIMEIGG